MLVATLLSTVSQAQFNSRLIKIDTSITTGSVGKIGLNKLDSQATANDGYSYKKIVLALSDTATLDFASAGATTVSDLTKTISGAKIGDEVTIGVPNASITTTGSYFGWVSAANTVTIRFSPKATENPASGVFHITVIKYKIWH